MFKVSLVYIVGSKTQRNPDSKTKTKERRKRRKKKKRRKKRRKRKKETLLGLSEYYSYIITSWREYTVAKGMD